MAQPLDPLVHEVANLLRDTKTQIVFAESCTAGLISASLARVPGISDFLCGSAVVYQYETKTNWLGVLPGWLTDHGAVNDPVAKAMAIGVLNRTPRATFSASITGHLGPGAPLEEDGLIYVALARRVSVATIETISVHEFRLPSTLPEPIPAGMESLREWRQWRAVEYMLTLIRDYLISPLP